MSTTRKTANVIRSVLLGLCVAGAWISAQLLKAHAGPWPGSNRTVPAAYGICGRSADGTSGCDAALKSKWSAVDLQVPIVTRTGAIQRSRVLVPVAFLGLAYFVFLGTWFAFAGPPEFWGRLWALLPFLTVLGAATASVFFLWVMLSTHETLCIGCLLTHVINGLLLAGVLAIRLLPDSGRPAKTASPGQADSTAHGPARLSTGAALRVIGFSAVLIAGLWVYRNAKLEIRTQVAGLLPYKTFVHELENDPEFLLHEFFAQPRERLLSPSGDGPAKAAHDPPTVHIFTDFQCPHCACFATQWKRNYLRAWNGPLRVKLHHYPLCRACNDTVSGDVHPEACRASYAAEAARLQGGDDAFWKMHDLLFAHGRRLDQKSYEAFATRLKLDPRQLLQDMAGDTVRRTVAADIALAEQIGVNGTPAVFLDGRRVPRLCVNNPVFWEAVGREFGNPDRIAARRGSHDTACDAACQTCRQRLLAAAAEKNAR